MLRTTLESGSYLAILGYGSNLILIPSEPAVAIATIEVGPAYECGRA